MQSGRLHEICQSLDCMYLLGSTCKVEMFTHFLWSTFLYHSSAYLFHYELWWSSKSSIVSSSAILHYTEFKWENKFQSVFFSKLWYFTFGCCSSNFQCCTAFDCFQWCADRFFTERPDEREKRLIKVNSASLQIWVPLSEMHSPTSKIKAQTQCCYL